MEAEGIISDAFLSNHPTEAARAIERHSLPEIAGFLADAAPAQLGPVVAAMDPAVAAAALAEVAEDRAAQMMEELPPPAASVLLRLHVPALRERILGRMAPSAASRVRTRLRYPPGTAGALLDPIFLTAAQDQTVAETLTRLRQVRLSDQAYLFVTAADGVLIGIVGFGELLTAATDARMGAMARREFTAIRASAERTTIVTHPAWGDLLTPPVVDSAGRLVGIMRYDTVRELAAEAAMPVDGATAAALEVGELAWSTGIATVGALMDAFSAVPRQLSDARTDD